MTDNRPRPKYGEYAPIPPAPADGAHGAPREAVEPAQKLTEATTSETTPSDAAATELPQRRTWDVVLTTFLLLIGVYDVVTGFSRFADLGAALNDAYAAEGLGTFTSIGLASAVGLVVNVARIVLLVVAILWSLRRISRHRLSFWVPLGCAAVAGIIVAVCVLAVVISDPALAAYVANQGTAQ